MGKIELIFGKGSGTHSILISNYNQLIICVLHQFIEISKHPGKELQLFQRIYLVIIWWLLDQCSVPVQEYDPLFHWSYFSFVM